MSTVLSLNHLSKSFGRRKIIEDLSCDFGTGVYGLLGPNGSGKTTLIRCVTLHYREGRRALRFRGEPVRSLSAYLRHIGYLPQQFGLFKELSVHDMMRYIASLKGLKRSAAEPEIDRLLELFRLGGEKEKKIATLSGGMVRRLGIAQAMLGRPPLLIFDEPTAGLDPEERLNFKGVIAEIKKQHCILLSTHIVGDVEACCDRVLILKDRGIARSGSCAELSTLAAGKVFEVPEADKEGLRGRYHISNRYEREGERYLRVLSAERQSFPPLAPTLEDAYVCVMQGIVD